MNPYLNLKSIKLRNKNFLFKSLAFCIVLLFIICIFYINKSINIITKYNNNNFTSKNEATGKLIQTNSLAKNIKIVCYILLQEQKVRVAKIIKETWGQYCDKLVFYGNFVTTAPVNVTQVFATEGYQFLWGKTKAALIHLENTYSQEYDWFLKADDDTFVIMENLREFISKSISDFEDPVWFGFKMKHMKMNHGYMSGGAGYVLNSKALKKLVSLFRENSKKDYIRMDYVTGNVRGCKTVENQGIEDLELGRCFHAVGVKDVKSFDLEGKERFLPLSLSTLMSGDVPTSHWLWRQAWNPFKPGKHCCSTNLISMHEVSPSQMKLLFFLLYQIQRPKKLTDKSLN